MKNIITIIAITAAVSVASLAAETKTDPNRVKITNFNFTPRALTIHTGTKVTWVNEDDVPHTVTSPEKKFKSRALDTDEAFTYTFSTPGTYTYFCSVHPHMTGKIIVQ
ncbi:MAG: amicyanin [Verrucomicrobiales bacterium]|nr:amicyanin [Verrucomicrobiales bacterium]